MEKESILSYLAQKNGNELQELKKEITLRQKEIEILRTEVELLEQTENQMDLFMEYAQNQSKKAADNIYYLINQELAQIENKGRIISEKHKQRIDELDLKMQNGIQYAYKIMNDVQEKQYLPVKPEIQEIQAKAVYENQIQTRTVFENQIQTKTGHEGAGEIKIVEGFWEDPKVEMKPAVKTEISEQENGPVFKNAYVIGKFAGDDLFDKSGKLIIAKNEIITQDIIEKAEKEGKMIELVLEMKLQEG
ncbi:MAG: hypothetical protein ACYCYI_10810 [Saccharofermentanales bacterium]